MTKVVNQVEACSHLKANPKELYRNKMRLQVKNKNLQVKKASKGVISRGMKMVNHSQGIHSLKIIRIKKGMNLMTSKVFVMIFLFLL
jgi:hypothetical protein